MNGGQCVVIPHIPGKDDIRHARVTGFLRQPPYRDAGQDLPGNHGPSDMQTLGGNIAGGDPALGYKVSGLMAKGLDNADQAVRNHPADVQAGLGVCPGHQVPAGVKNDIPSLPELGVGLCCGALDLSLKAGIVQQVGDPDLDGFDIGLVNQSPDLFRCLGHIGTDHEEAAICRIGDQLGPRKKFRPGFDAGHDPDEGGGGPKQKPTALFRRPKKTFHHHFHIPVGHCVDDAGASVRHSAQDGAHPLRAAFTDIVQGDRGDPIGRDTAPCLFGHPLFKIGTGKTEGCILGIGGQGHGHQALFFGHVVDVPDGEPAAFREKGKNQIGPRFRTHGFCHRIHLVGEVAP